MRGFYAILDATLARAKEIDEVALGRALLSARPAALQLRAKDLSARETLALLRNLLPLCQRAKVPLVAIYPKDGPRPVCDGTPSVGAAM